MSNHILPIRFFAVLAFLHVVNAAMLPYAASPRLHSYYYPTPRNQLTIPQSVPISMSSQYRQQYASYAQTQQQHYTQQQQNQYTQQQPQKYQQQYGAHSSIQPVTKYYQHKQQLPASVAANVAKQFGAPALDNAAFTTALTSQGYPFGAGGGSVGSDSSSIHSASPASAARALPSTILESFAAGNDVAPEGAIDPSDASVNLQLPLPVNLAPINVQPLPLQAGVSFSELANGVTSYGTVYPQRKRR